MDPSTLSLLQPFVEPVLDTLGAIVLVVLTIVIYCALTRRRGALR
jgi:hypothetical protein